MFAPSYVWARIISRLEQQLTQITVSCWFDDTQVISLTDTELTVFSPTDFRRQIIQDRCGSYIRQYLQEIMGHPMVFTVLGEQELRRRQQPPPVNPSRNPQFTFETFIAGNSNLMALKVAKAVAQAPGQVAYNPFYLYGPPGIGKTHLLYAIANEITKTKPTLRVTYVRSEDFTSELICALRCGDKAAFKEKYRMSDVLLMDDIQFIAGKEATQEEFYNTFNTLIEAGKQIVISSDRRPWEMATLQERLRSRFDAAVPICIQPPDYETRLTLVRTLSDKYTLGLQEADMQFIAQVLVDNLRLVEGGMKRLRAYRELMDMPMTSENVRNAILELRQHDESKVSAQLVIRNVCKYYGLEDYVLCGPQRTRGVALPRQIAMYLVRHMAGASLEQIGRLFGGRDRTTVVHSIKKVEAALEAPDAALASVLEDIRENIKNTPY